MPNVSEGPTVRSCDLSPRLDDAWFSEVASLIEATRRPDAYEAFVSRLLSRIGGTRDFSDAIRYLSSSLYAAARYAGGLVDLIGVDAVPAARNAPKTIRRQVVRDGDGRITAVEDRAV